MKRVGFIVFGAIVAAVLTAPMGFDVSRGGLDVRAQVALGALTCPGGAVPADNGVCIGQPGAGSPAPAPPAKGNPLAGSGGIVCVAVPIGADPAKQGGCAPGQEEIPNDPASGGAIVAYLKMVLKLLNGIVGGIIMLVLVIAGIQYITSRADPAQVKAAKQRIQQALTALVLYMLMFAILNFLVPGGLLK